MSRAQIKSSAAANKDQNRNCHFEVVWIGVLKGDIISPTGTVVKPHLDIEILLVK